MEVYYLHKIPTKGNSYTVGRNEDWHFAYECTFKTLVEAQEYVISKNREKCSYELSIQGCTDMNIIRHRCLSKEYNHFHKYFVGKPTHDDVAVIKDKLRKEGIIV